MQQVGRGGKDAYRCAANFSPRFQPLSTHFFRPESIWHLQAGCLQQFPSLLPSEAIVVRRRPLVGIPNV